MYIACNQCGTSITDGQCARMHELPGALCYACAAVADALDMAWNGTAVLYLADDAVTNWPGTLRMRVLSVRKSRFRGFYGARVDRTDVRFIGPDGAVWCGRHCGDNDILRAHRMATSRQRSYASTLAHFQ